MHNSSGSSGGFFKKHAVSLIMGALLALIGLLLFSDFSKTPVIVSDAIDPYVLSTRGKTLVFRDKLITVSENKEEKIFVGDRIKTLDSTATIFWPDGSITRLGERSSIVINEMRATTASEHIQIDFSLEQGKSWSNVIRYLFDDSYFHQRYNDDTALAAVRGTVFEVNLDKKYIHTIDHGVSIEDVSGHTGSILLVAGGVLDTTTRQAILKDRIDTAWNALNTNADIVYLNERLEKVKKEIFETFGQENYFTVLQRRLGIQDENPLSSENSLKDAEGWIFLMQEIKKNRNTQENLMNLYQKLYGLPNTQNVLETKIELRDSIIETAPESKKQELLTDFARSTVYDIWKQSEVSGTGGLQKLEEKLNLYMKNGADIPTIDSLMNGITNDDIIKANTTLEDIKKKLLDTLGKKNLMDEVTKKIPIEKINNEATKVREGLSDTLQELITQ